MDKEVHGLAHSPTTSCLKVPHFISNNLKSVHFKDSSIKIMIIFNIENDHNFDRTEDRATVFLK